MNSLIRSKVLIVDDEFINREILWNILKDKYDLDYAEDGNIALEKIYNQNESYDLILLDLLMPNKDGYEVLKQCKNDGILNDIPFIVMTSEKDAELECLRIGAVDFIKKPYDMPDVIIARCERIIELFHKTKIINSTEKDELTGLYTINYFYEYIERLKKITAEVEMDAIVIDFDNFHQINELYGKNFGDEVLKIIAKSLDEYIGTDGICSRMQADIFFVYCKHMDDHKKLLDFLVGKLSDVEKVNSNNLRLGVFEKVPQDMDGKDLFVRAKIAVKENRGNYIKRISYYDEALSKEATYTHKLINDFEDGIMKKQFVVYYQPKYSIQSDEYKIVSAEALIRWIHPELGMISPGVFIPLFEKNGLIAKLDNYIWNEVARQIREWKDNFNKSIPVSINISRVDLLDPNLANVLVEIINNHNLSTDDIYLEITESAYMEDGKGLLDLINVLKEKGFKIEMDDFGSGYSSLGMLSDIKLDVLKIDRSFIKDMENSENKRKLVEQIITIAKMFNLTTVAEGVEKEFEVDVLKQMGCDIIQGFYFSKPLPKEEITELINNC